MNNLDIVVEGLSAIEITAQVEKMINVAKTAVKYVAIAAQAYTKRETPVYQGVLARSWTIRQHGEMSWKVVTPIKYVNTVIGGSIPGPVPYAPIAQWATRKGLPPGPVYGKIRYHGSTPNDFITRAVDLTEPQVPSLLQRALREANL